MLQVFPNKSFKEDMEAGEERSWEWPAGSGGPEPRAQPLRAVVDQGGWNGSCCSGGLLGQPAAQVRSSRRPRRQFLGPPWCCLCKSYCGDALRGGPTVLPPPCISCSLAVGESVIQPCHGEVAALRPQGFPRPDPRCPVPSGGCNQVPPTGGLQTAVRFSQFCQVPDQGASSIGLW